ncbi:MAG: methyl-accepting chemotaxis protein [Sporolactobacillus sp.]
MKIKRLSIKQGKRHWNGFTINQRHLLNISIIFLLMSIAVGLSAGFLWHADQAAQQVGKVGNRVAQITEIGSLFRQKDTRVVDYLLNPGDQSIKKYTNDQHVLTIAETNMRPYMKTAQQKQLLSQIMRNDSLTYNLFQNEFAPAVLMNDQQKALRLRREQEKIQIGTMKKLTSLRQTVLDEQKSAVLQATTQIGTAISCVAVSLILSMLIGGWITFRIQRRIRRSMNQVLDMTDKMTSGDLRIALKEMRGRDEIGRIGQSIIQLNQQLTNMTQAISQLTGAAKTNSQSLSRSVQSVSDSSLQVEQTLSELSTGIANQMEHVTRIAAQTGMFVNRLESEAERVASTHQTAQEAVQLTEKGQASMKQSITLITSIQNGVAESSEKLKMLENHVVHVSKINQSIKKIAEQTNLLALNATIEAARSQGVQNGFSVIATAIRKLSDQTADLVKQIGQIVDGVYLETHEVRRALIRNNEQVRVGIEQIAETGSQFSTIQKQMLNVGEKMSLMDHNIQGISTFGLEIKQSVEGILSVFKETAAGISEISQSTQGINRTVMNFARETDSMDDKSGRLEVLISHFKYS